MMDAARTRGWEIVPMGLAELIRALSDPSSYPDPVGDEAIEVHQTHISIVFLAGAHAYKIKKPVSLGFVDYGTLERRRHFCEREVRLNRRLAPSVYLGTVPIAIEGGKLRVEGIGEVAEWAVKMVRLPVSATLHDRLERGAVGVEQVEALARRLARFHAGAESGPSISESGRFAVVAGNALENFDQSAPLVGKTVSAAVIARLQDLTERALTSLRPTIETRAARGVPRDGHGDLRLDHVYLFPEKQPPDDLVVVDAIEFADRFRHADPFADIAFLAMDLRFRGRGDLAGAFVEAYEVASGDVEGLSLLPFYIAYRAVVRAKVEGMKSDEPEVAVADRDAARIEARALWLLALRTLEAPGRRPCLVLVGGLPGSGKSTLARALAERAGFTVIRSDVVRKVLAGLPETARGAAGFGEGIYTPEWTDRTYSECLRRAEALLFEGKRVLVDASFGAELSRSLFLDAAEKWHLPRLLLLCRAGPDAIRERLRARVDDASDADWSIHEGASKAWETPGPASRPFIREVSTDRDTLATLAQALAPIAALDLEARIAGTP